MAQNPTVQAAITTCIQCQGWWGELKTAHCTQCHRTFTTPANFDRHRTGSHTGARTCIPPTEAGLVDAGRAYPCWGQPGRDDGGDAA